MRCAIPIFLLLSVSACSMSAPKPARSQLQIREFQTRTFPKSEKHNLVMMKALINVLQDDGFIVRNADKDLGYVVASKETPMEHSWTDWLTLGDNREPRYP